MSNERKTSGIVFGIIGVIGLWAYVLYGFSVEVSNSIPEFKEMTVTMPGKIEIEATKAGAIREVTAYNVGDITQCWGDPCVSANGSDICSLVNSGEKLAAANFVPFGTILRIEGLGDYRVIDRMNERYGQRIDIAMPLSEKKQAIKFGLKRLRVEILQ